MALSRHPLSPQGTFQSTAQPGHRECCCLTGSHPVPGADGSLLQEAVSPAPQWGRAQTQHLRSQENLQDLAQRAHSFWAFTLLCTFSLLCRDITQQWRVRTDPQKQRSEDMVNSEETHEELSNGWIYYQEGGCELEEGLQLGFSTSQCSGDDAGEESSAHRDEGCSRLSGTSCSGFSSLFLPSS